MANNKPKLVINDSGLRDFSSIKHELSLIDEKSVSKLNEITKGKSSLGRGKGGSKRRKREHVVSKGEQACMDVLNDMGISFTAEYKIKAFRCKRYDFHFIHNGYEYLLEWDGSIHFSYTPYIHKSEASFRYRQRMDCLKMKAALVNGYRVIRIDYTQIDHIRSHLENALKDECRIYVSDTNKYKYIPMEKYLREIDSNKVTISF